ncbi:glycosyltransferase family 2 protein [Lysobacter claricitrinus]|uniref:glycosyltransferase family 2 protein n=1 Tax=Lysobacter claricitrinus TaxID=3367728 RepID=UPI0037DBEE91
MRARDVHPAGVTAVVLNYRTPEKTLACLASLVAEGIEKIVLVENSGDGGASLDAMRIGLDGLIARGIDLATLDPHCNLGFAAGVNLALRLIEARGATPVLLMNSDARLTRGSLVALVEALGDAPVVSPCIEIGGVPSSPRLYYQRFFATLTVRRVWGSVPYIAAACLLLSDELVAPDLFDEDFFFYGEDIALGAKLQRLDKACVVVSNARATHEGAGSSRRGSMFYEYHINRGHWLLARKLTVDRSRYALALLGRSFTLTLRALYRCVRLRSVNPLRGFLLATRDAMGGRQSSGIKPTGASG